jgi:hypothetical protein
MPEKHRVAVLFALDPNSPSPRGVGPSEPRLRHVLDTGDNSVRNFWADNVPYIDVQMTVFPRVTINPDRTPLPNGAARPRSELIDAVVAASRLFGFNRASFDHIFAVVHGGDGFEYGASGRGRDAVVLTHNDFSTICHEFGHCLGFDHSRGFRSTRAGVWSDDYGSYYDVMAFPSSYKLAQQDQLPPGEPLAGPMIARAVVHYDKPNALREIGKVLELDLRDAPISEQVWAAGRSGPGQPELLVFYTDGVRDARHQVMVEYRQPDPSGTGRSRWDQGLNGLPSQGNAPGVVVYTVQVAKNPDGSDSYFDRPYYSGTVSLAAADYDVDVAFPWGTYTVALKPSGGVDDPAPDHVEVTVGRAPLGPAKVRIMAEPSEVVETQRTEMRLPPNLPPLFGPQEYVISATFTTWRLSAHTTNVGGLSSLQQAEDSTLEWTVDGVVIPPDGTVHNLREGLFTAQVARGTRMLTVRNPNALAQSAVVVAKVHAWDYGAGAHLKSEYEMTFAGETAEPSEALQRLLTWYDLKFRRRFPKPRPPKLLDIQQLRFAYRELERTAPRLAALIKPLMDDEEAAWRRQLAAEVAWRRQ